MQFKSEFRSLCIYKYILPDIDLVLPPPNFVQQTVGTVNPQSQFILHSAAVIPTSRLFGLSASRTSVFIVIPLVLVQKLTICIKSILLGTSGRYANHLLAFWGFLFNEVIKDRKLL